MSRSSWKECLSDRVRFSELDPQGVVFYSRYFEYADAAILNYLRIHGISFDDGDSPCDFQVRKSAADYRRPLNKNEEFEALVRVKKLGTSSALFEVSIIERRSREQCCALELLHVLVDLNSAKATPIPDSIRMKLESD